MVTPLHLYMFRHRTAIFKKSAKTKNYFLSMYDMMIYLLTAIVLSSGGSTHLHTNNA